MENKPAVIPTLYVSRKVVLATPINRGEIGGMEIEHQDGHVSFCPLHTFKRDYVEIGAVEFHESDDQVLEHVDGRHPMGRLAGELAQLRHDNNLLQAFISSSRIDALPAEAALLLKQQYATQVELLDILEKRLKVGGFDIVDGYRYSTSPILSEGPVVLAVEDVSIKRDGLVMLVSAAEVKEGDVYCKDGLEHKVRAVQKLPVLTGVPV